MAAAAALSSRSNHPVSKAVSALREAADRQLPAVDVVDFKLVPGAPPGADGAVPGWLIRAGGASINSGAPCVS